MKYFMIIIKSTYELDGILKFFFSLSVLEILVIRVLHFFSYMNHLSCINYGIGYFITFVTSLDSSQRKTEDDVNFKDVFSSGDFDVVAFRKFVGSQD